MGQTISSQCSKTEQCVLTECEPFECVLRGNSPDAQFQNMILEYSRHSRGGFAQWNAHHNREPLEPSATPSFLPPLYPDSVVLRRPPDAPRVVAGEMMWNGRACSRSSRPPEPTRPMPKGGTNLREENVVKCASLLPNEWLECEDVNPRSWQSLEHAHGSAGCSSLTSSGADLPSKLSLPPSTPPASMTNGSNHGQARKPRACPSPPPPPSGEWDSFSVSAVAKHITSNISFQSRWDDLVNSAAAAADAALNAAAPPPTQLSLQRPDKDSFKPWQDVRCFHGKLKCALCGPQRHLSGGLAATKADCWEHSTRSVEGPREQMQKQEAVSHGLNTRDACNEGRPPNDTAEVVAEAPEALYQDPGPPLFGPWPPTLEVPRTSSSHGGSLSVPSLPGSSRLNSRSLSAPILSRSRLPVAEKGHRCVVTTKPVTASVCHKVMTSRSTSPWLSLQSRRAPVVSPARQRV